MKVPRQGLCGASHDLQARRPILTIFPDRFRRKVGATSHEGEEFGDRREVSREDGALLQGNRGGRREETSRRVGNGGGFGTRGALIIKKFWEINLGSSLLLLSCSHLRKAGKVLSR